MSRILRRARNLMIGLPGVIMMVLPTSAADHLRDLPGLSTIVFRINVSNPTGTAEYAVRFEEGIWDPEESSYTWNLPAALDLTDTVGGWIATLTNASVFVRVDQGGEIELSIGVISGPQQTDVIIGSPLVMLSEPIPASYARGRATASVTLTDAAGDGAMIVGLGATGVGIYRSYFNGFLTAGTRFTHLVGLISVTGGGTATASQSDPAAGYRPINRTVRDMSVMIAFSISPLELAYATTSTGFPAAPPCPGDVNANGRVDTDDLAAMLGCYGTCEPDPGYDPACDSDDSGCVDLGDLGTLLGHYGMICW